MLNESSNKPKEQQNNNRTTIWSRVGSLAFGSLFKPVESFIKEETKSNETYSVTKSVIDDSIEISKNRYLSDLSESGEKQITTDGKIKIYKPGNYIIIFYSKTDSSNEVKTLNKFYEISRKELYTSYPFEEKIDKKFFKEGQRLLYQKFGESAKDYALDYSKVGIARIHNDEFITTEVEFPTDSTKEPLSFNPNLIQ